MSSYQTVGTYIVETTTGTYQYNGYNVTLVVGSGGSSYNDSITLSNSLGLTNSSILQYFEALSFPCAHTVVINNIGNINNSCTLDITSLTNTDNILSSLNDLSLQVIPAIDNSGTFYLLDDISVQILSSISSDTSLSALDDLSMQITTLVSSDVTISALNNLSIQITPSIVSSASTISTDLLQLDFSSQLTTDGTVVVNGTIFVDCSLNTLEGLSAESNVDYSLEIPIDIRVDSTPSSVLTAISEIVLSAIHSDEILGGLVNDVDLNLSFISDSGYDRIIDINGTLELNVVSNTSLDQSVIFDTSVTLNSSLSTLITNSILTDVLVAFNNLLNYGTSGSTGKAHLSVDSRGILITSNDRKFLIRNNTNVVLVSKNDNNILINK